MQRIIDKIKAHTWTHNVIIIWCIDIIIQIGFWCLNGFTNHYWFNWQHNMVNIINTGFGIVMLIGFSIIRWWSWSHDQLDAYQHQNQHHM